MLLLALGTNLGERLENLTLAIDELTNAGIRITKQSSIYETAALLPEGAPAEWNIPYLNMVVRGEADLKPNAVLEITQQIQNQMGREDIGRWGPRIIDIDLLDVNGEICTSDRLTLPHPEMLKRDFVMVPLTDVAPEWVHPLSGQRADQWAAAQNFTCGEYLKRVSP